MRVRVLMMLVAATLTVQGLGCCRCCRCCRCFGGRDSRLPPQDLPREDRIPPAGLRSEGTPASLPKTDGANTKPTGAYGGS